MKGGIIDKILGKGIKPQFLLFSATPPGENSVEEGFKEAEAIVGECTKIKLPIQKLMGRLDHIHQYHMKCEKGKKIDFIKNIFDTLQMT